MQKVGQAKGLKSLNSCLNKLNNGITAQSRAFKDTPAIL